MARRLQLHLQFLWEAAKGIYVLRIYNTHICLHMVHGLAAIIFCFFLLHYNPTTATQYNGYTSIYIYAEGLFRRRAAPLPQNHVRSGALPFWSLFSWLCGGHQQWPFIYNALWAQLGMLLWGKEACMQILVPFHCHAACWPQCAW